MLLLFLISRQHNPINQVFNTPNIVYYVSLLPNGIIERWVILDYFIIVIYQPYAMNAKNEKLFFTKCFRKTFFSTQHVKQAWLQNF